MVRPTVNGMRTFIWGTYVRTYTGHEPDNYTNENIDEQSSWVKCLGIHEIRKHFFGNEENINSILNQLCISNMRKYFYFTENTGAFPFHVTAFGERTAIEKVFKHQFSSPSMNELMLQTSVDCKRSSNTNTNTEFNCTIDVTCPTCSTAVSSLLYESRISWFILMQCCIGSFLLYLTD